VATPQPLPAPPAEFISQVMRCQRRLYAFVYALIRNPADADDVLQETNLVLWQKAGEFTPGTDFLAWAFRIAHFQVMAFRKRHGRSYKCFDDALIQSLADRALELADEFDPRLQALRECLKLLPSDLQRLLAARYEPGGSVNEIARRNGTTPKAISEALRRARKALMRCIQRRLTLERERWLLL
jgi:RNA polymerase sigma-70 factor, ECF subfamily